MKAVLRSLSVLAVLMLAACSQIAPTATLMPTATPNPSATPTITPSPTPIFTPMPTIAPTEVKLAYEEIRPENAQNLSLINVIGFGWQDINYSLDGSQIAIVSNLKTCIYDASTFMQLKCFGTEYYGGSVMLSDDFSTLLYGGVEKFTILDTTDGSRLEQEISQEYCKNFDFQRDAVIKAISSDNHRAIIGICQSILVWDLVSNQEISSEKSEGNINVNKFIFSPDNHYLLRSINSNNGIVELFAFPDMKKVKNFYTEGDTINEIGFSPDQRYIYTIGAGDLRTGGLFMYGTGTTILNVFSLDGTLVHQAESVEKVGFLQDGAIFYEISNGVINEYDTDKWGYRISSQESQSWEVIAPDKSSALMRKNEAIEFWRLDPLKMMQSVTGMLSARQLRFTPDNKAIWVGLAKYDVLTGEELKRIDLNFKSTGLCSTDPYFGIQEEMIQEFSISFDERWAVYVTDCSRLVLIDLDTGEEITLRPYGENISGYSTNVETRVRFTPDNQYLAFEYYATGLTLYPLTDLDNPIYQPFGVLSIWLDAGVINSSENWSEESMRQVPFDGYIYDTSGVIDPLGDAYYRVKYMGIDEQPLLWKNSRNSEPIRFESDKPGRIFIISFIPKTSMFVGYIENGDLQEFWGVWDVQTGDLLKKFPYKKGYDYYDVAVSPDGTMIAMVNSGLQIWGIPHP